MKIPILAAFALLALVGAQDTDQEVEERRLDDRGWYSDDDNSDTKQCGWKVYKYDGKCAKSYFCKKLDDDGKATGDYEKKSGKYIDDEYCGISSSSTTTTTTSSSSDSSSSDCKKWKKKYKKCKKKNKTKKCKKKSYYKKYKKHC